MKAYQTLFLTVSFFLGFNNFLFAQKDYEITSHKYSIGAKYRGVGAEYEYKKTTKTYKREQKKDKDYDWKRVKALPNIKSRTKSNDRNLMNVEPRKRKKDED